MSKAFAPVLVLGMALPLAGCDTSYGVSRDTYLSAQPALDCVRHAIETAAGVATVQYAESHTGKGLLHPTPWVYTYDYAGPPGSNIRGVLQLYKDHKGHFTVRNHHWRMHEPPPQAVIDASRPVMRAVERNIARQCDITELASKVRERCTGVVCNPLPD